MGGLEVYARRLTEALARRDDVRLTLLLAPPPKTTPGASWGASSPFRWTRAGARSGCSPTSSTCRGPRPAPAPRCCTAWPRPARSRPVSAGRDRARPQLPDAPRGPLRAPRARHAGARAGGRTPLAAGDRAEPARRPTTSPAIWASPRERIDVVPMAPGHPPRPGRRTRDEMRAELGAGERPAAPDGLGQAAAQEPGAAARRRWRSLDAGRPAAAGAARLSRRRTRTSCAPAPTSSGSRATCVSRLGLGPGARGPLPRRRRLRLPVARRGLRPAGARGDGARRACRDLGTHEPRRGGGRRRAAVRPRRRGARSPTAIERLLDEPGLAARLAAAGPGERRALHLGAPPAELPSRATGARSAAR